MKGSLVEKTFSKNALLCSISFILLYRSPGRSSPSSQLLVMNPFFYACLQRYNYFFSPANFL